MRDKPLFGRLVIATAVFAAACEPAIESSEYSTAGTQDGAVVIPSYGRGGIAVTEGQSASFYVDIPVPARKVTISIDGDNGDADLYTLYEAFPTTTLHDCGPFKTGSVETCEYENTPAGRYWVLIHAYSTFHNLTLSSSYEPEEVAPEATSLDERNLGVTTEGNELSFRVKVAAGADRLVVRMAGGTGDADLYLKWGKAPTTVEAADCAPYLVGNDEECIVESPTPGTWHIAVRAYRPFDGVRLTATVDRSQSCGSEQPTMWEPYGFEVRRVLLEEIFFDQRETLYCECEFNEFKRVDHTSCGYEMPPQESGRAGSMEWEHVVPAFRMNYNRPCRTQCSTLGARECCRETDTEFAMMEGDLHNLKPSVGQVNGVRGSRDFGIVSGERRDFGACDVEFSGNIIEPRPAIRGNIARTYLYMEATYTGFELTDSERALFEQWNADDPVDEEERDLNQRIQAHQGNTNPFIESAGCLPDS